MSIFILGSINYDIVAKAEKLPSVGETVEGHGVEMFTGGKGSNQATQTALLGAKTVFLGNTGDDDNGRIVRENLGGKGVDTTFLNIEQGGKTGVCTIYVDKQGKNMLVYSPGTNRTLTPALVDSALEVLKTCKLFITQCETDLATMEYGLKKAKELGVTTILNPAPALPLSDSVFALCDYILPNETESEVFTGILRKDMPLDVWAKQSAQWFLDKGCKNVCITLGEKGSYFNNGSEEYIVPTFDDVKPVDTTAAGDSFIGGFAYGLSVGMDVRQALRYGNACGSLAIMTVGAQNSIRGKAEVEQFLKEHE